eukprot:3703814-Pleurochrysis_carterae.AAC.1
MQLKQRLQQSTSKQKGHGVRQQPRGCTDTKMLGKMMAKKQARVQHRRAVLSSLHRGEQGALLYSRRRLI